MRHSSIIFFILILLITSLSSCKFFKEKKLFGRKADTMLVWQARQDSIRIADSIRLEQERLLAIENARLDSIKKAEEERLEWERRYRYNIIVGSFITPEYARDLAGVYDQMGYETRIIKMEGSTFELVSAEVHDNFSMAVQRLEEFQDTVEVEAWMYIRR